MADTPIQSGLAPSPTALPPGMPGIPPVNMVDCDTHWRAGAREIRVFRGHHDPVWTVAYHPDGTTVASGSVDHTIRIWELETGRMLRILRGHTDSVRCLTFSPDGQILASGSSDRTIRIWNPKTGEFVRMLFGRYDHAVYSLSFSPDSLMLARGNENRDIKIWEVGTATELLSLLPQDEYDRHWNICTVFSPDGRLLASGNDVGGMTLFEVLPSGQELCKPDGHKSDPFDGTVERRGFWVESQEGWEAAFENWIGSLAFSPDGTMLVSGSRDKTMKFWEVPSGKLLRTVKAHSGWVRGVTFSPDGKILASCSDDTTIKLWDPKTGRPIRTLKGHKEPVRSIAFSPDGRRLVSGSLDRTVKLWEGG
ncbi:MAG TPA: WD40 repeat domain-containing protein, partial [Nitrospirales bacterium]|nr:WD40 repeat domain-containing protein [Nitrospirales bacterium]